MTGACGQKSPGPHTGAAERRTWPHKAGAGGVGVVFNGKLPQTEQDVVGERSQGRGGGASSHLLEASYSAQTTAISENRKH